MRNAVRPRAFQRGITYVECMVAVAILAMTLAPALLALRDATAAVGRQKTYTVNQQRVKARMEEVLANKFNTLDVAAVAAGNSPSAISSTYSDPSGTPDRLTVTLYRYNGTAATGTDTGLLWVNVSIAGSALSLNTLKSRW